MRDIIKEVIELERDIHRLHEQMYAFSLIREDGSEEEYAKIEGEAEANYEQIFAYHQRVREIGKQLTLEEMVELILNHSFQLDYYPTLDADQSFQRGVLNYCLKADGFYELFTQKEHTTPEEVSGKIEKVYHSSMLKVFNINPKRGNFYKNWFGPEYHLVIQYRPTLS
ncbi:hypothetical protein [Marininema halotolerans]|uniref:Uncharacterized protein n=1 Tax=Marininema halotolerans TaxID=1155944 RepID=A0A1I6UB88_9BACL|nr:hypothetical protein [Marininema halotolerans]SFS98638.1 hypothetical protein SAMN05444972_11512 [Marininema halotolerans]